MSQWSGVRAWTIYGWSRPQVPQSLTGPFREQLADLAPEDTGHCSHSSESGSTPSPSSPCALPVASFTPPPTPRGAVFPFYRWENGGLFGFKYLTKWWEPALKPVFWFQRHISTLISRRWGSRHWRPSVFHTWSPAPGSAIQRHNQHT